MNEPHHFRGYKISDEQTLFIDSLLQEDDTWMSRAYTRGQFIQQSGSFEDEMLYELFGFLGRKEAGDAMVQRLREDDNYKEYIQDKYQC